MKPAKWLLAPILMLAAAASAARTLDQQRPDFTGGWMASKDAPPALAAAPSPVFGARFWLEQKGDRLTIIRPVRDSAIAISHALDGTEVRTRITGSMCLGDTGTITSVAWDGNAIVHRIHGSLPPGATTPVPASVRQVFRQLTPDRLVAEGVMRVAGQSEMVPVGTVYTRMTDAPPAPSPPPSIAGAPASLSKLAWLGGTWSGSLGTSTVEERWTPASGGSMLATSRTVTSAGSVNAFEYLCIAERAGSLVYTAMPNGRSPATDFTLTAIDDTSATFENPAHDFPKMIRYALRPDGTLEATISGAAGQRSTTYTFRRQNQ